MKIGIIGTRGIPNLYGGFEQFVENISPMLVEKGHEVYVYNSSLHPYAEKTWKGVHIIRQTDWEDRLGPPAQFLYDLNCILDARSRQYDIILQLGYTSSSIWSFLFPRKVVIITNMDGLEWKRTKYNKPTRRFLQLAEKWAVKYSDYLIADSKGIRKYLLEKYRVDSSFIAYGANVFSDPDAGVPAQYGLRPYDYNIIIARMEPENNIEPVLKAHAAARNTTRLLVVGNHKNRFGTYLHKKYSSENIIFAGAVYNIAILNNLRYFSNLYFHGHSVGGTNPSLLEAMASHCLIVANDNPFNRTVLEEDAFYFNEEEDIVRLLDAGVQKAAYEGFMSRNTEKIAREYSWNYIAGRLLNLFEHAVSNR